MKGKEEVREREEASQEAEEMEGWWRGQVVESKHKKPSASPLKNYSECARPSLFGRLIQITSIISQRPADKTSFAPGRLLLWGPTLQHPAPRLVTPTSSCQGQTLCRRSCSVPRVIIKVDVCCHVYLKDKVLTV